MKKSRTTYSNHQDSFLDDLESYLDDLNTSFYFFSSKAKKHHTEVKFSPDDHLIFGSETTGLLPHFHEKWPSHFLKIPMKEGARCLNLANSVAVGLYEAWRQLQFT